MKTRNASQCTRHRSRCTKMYNVRKFANARVRNFYTYEHFFNNCVKAKHMPLHQRCHTFPHTLMCGLCYYPGQKNRYSREIHEADLQFDHVISCDIELWFDIDATRVLCASRAHVADRSRCGIISDDRTADQSHEHLGCNDFFWLG